MRSQRLCGHGHHRRAERERERAHKKLLYQINIIIRYKYKAPIYLTTHHRKNRI